jgi:hypothetical protein
VVDIHSIYSLGLRADKILSKKLGISREKIKRLCQESIIIGLDGEDILRCKLEVKKIRRYV